MIRKLKHTQIDIAEKIRAIFQVSYAVEADLLNAEDFPPLKRSVADFIKSTTDFYGYFEDADLAGIAEVKKDSTTTHIQSLVVDPYYFRQGIGKNLVAFVLASYKTEYYSVETGLANLPAITLYKKFGFKETRQWDTDHGVRKVRFEKRELL